MNKMLYVPFFVLAMAAPAQADHLGSYCAQFKTEAAIQAEEAKIAKETNAHMTDFMTKSDAENQPESDRLSNWQWKLDRCDGKGGVYPDGKVNYSRHI